MITLATNSNRDLYLTNNQLTVYSGLQALIQICEQKASTMLEEMIYAMDDGMPNFQVVWVGSPNLRQFEAYLRAALLSVTGVNEITNLIVAVRNNTLYYTATIKTIYGEATIG
jgi:hypothetical protein